MSFHYSPKVVSDNSLVFCLDSANIKSYPTSGTAWSDITRFGKSVSLINSPTFSASNSGVLVFDGVNEYGSIPYNSNFNLSNTDFTLEGWFMSNNFSNNQCILSNDTYGANFDWGLLIQDANTIFFFTNGTTTNITATVPTMMPGQWYNYVVTLSGTSSFRMYLNGLLVSGPTTISVSNSSQSLITIGALGGSGAQTIYNLNGEISILRVYRRALSQAEVSQNYNAIKSRYS